MTKGLESVFGLPSMDEILSETEVSDSPTELANDEIVQTSVNLPTTTGANPGEILISTALDQIDDHARAMDTIYADTLKHAVDASELAFDLDPARAPRMLEVSAIHYKAAMEAKNSKVEATMKMIKLVNETKKLTLDEQRIRHEMGTVPSDKADVILVEDRNTLLKRLKNELASDKKG
jgi:hypothetical protein